MDNPFGSDHVPVIVEIDVGAEATRACSTFKKVDWSSFTEYVDRKIEENDNPDYNHLFGVITESMESAALQPRNGRMAKIQQPWWDSELDNQVKKVRNLFRRWKNSGFTAAVYDVYLEEERRFKKMIKVKKSASWHRYCDSLSSDTSLPSLWRMARKYRGKSGGNNQMQNPELMNKILDRLAPASTQEEHLPVLQASEAGSECFFTIHDLLAVLEDTTNSTPGIDGIPYIALRNLPFNAKTVLLKIYNSVMLTGVIPDQWKVFRLVNILKPGQPAEEAKSYRPISLASCLRKTFEIMIKNRLKWHMEGNSFFM